MQPKSYECGYFVMVYMLKIVTDYIVASRKHVINELLNKLNEISTFTLEEGVEYCVNRR